MATHEAHTDNFRCIMSRQWPPWLPRTASALVAAPEQVNSSRTVGDDGTSQWCFLLSSMVAVPRLMCSTGLARCTRLHPVWCPMLYALGSFGPFHHWRPTGLFLAALGADVPLTQTYVVVARFTT